MIQSDSSTLKVLLDYDISLANGEKLQLTIDPDLDQAIEGPDWMKFVLAAKSLRLNPKVKSLPETITVNRAHIVSCRKVERAIVPMDPDLRQSWDDAIQRATGRPVLQSGHFT